jgi:predicted protein tyrosine phosphatase
MTPKLYWIDGPWPGKLAISARPRGGDWLEDEVSGWRSAGVDAVVSLLTPQENEDLQLAKEADFAQARGLRFLSLPIEDRGIPPSWDEASRAVAKAGELLRQGRNVAVHCRQGVGRSGMIAAALSAIRVRGLPVPETAEQRAWVREFSRKEASPAVPLSRASVK